MGRDHLSYYPDNHGDADICDRGGNEVAHMCQSMRDIDAGRRPTYHLLERDWTMDQLGRVLAAAPELHEALKWALPWLKLIQSENSSRVDAKELGSVLGMVHAALSKAEDVPEPVEIRDPTEYP